MLFGRFATIIALFMMSGLDRAVVQTYAWSTMVRDRIPTQGLDAAIQSTFSGEQPCQICDAIAAADRKNSETPNLPDPREKDLKIFSLTTGSQPTRLTPPSSSQLLPGFLAHADRSVTLELPTPPPRCA